MNVNLEALNEAEDIITRVVNAADSIIMIGEGIAQRHGTDCEEANALFYIGDTLRSQLEQVEKLLMKVRSSK